MSRFLDRVGHDTMSAWRYDVKLQFLGASRQVSGSRYCLETRRGRILIDCGMFQERAFLERNWLPGPIAADALDAVVLTHAHIDHSGLLPRLVRQGFRGPIHMTRPTVELAEVLLRDAARIQQEDTKYKQKRHAREGRTGAHPYEPLYQEADVDEACQLFRPADLDVPVRVLDGVDVTFRDAGHILGSASLEFQTRSPDNPALRIVFSGDIGQSDKPLMKEPYRFSQADYLIMESTYGDRLHEDRGDVAEQLHDVITSTVQRGGKIVIPTFAVERAQELVYFLSQLDQQKKLPAIPMFLDSPMAIDVTTIFRRFYASLDQDAQALLNHGGPPLGFPALRLSRTTEESKAINDVSGPALIMSTSGMCDAGRIKHHLRHYIEDPRSTILFVGYQAEGTLGRLILDGHKQVRIHGRSYSVRAKTRKIYGFSGHADRDGLLRWIGDLQPVPRETFLVHGEEKAALSLADRIGQRGWNVTVPEYLQVAELSPPT